MLTGCFSSNVNYNSKFTVKQNFANEYTNHFLSDPPYMLYQSYLDTTSQINRNYALYAAYQDVDNLDSLLNNYQSKAKDVLTYNNDCVIIKILNSFYENEGYTYIRNNCKDSISYIPVPFNNKQGVIQHFIETEGSLTYIDYFKKNDYTIFILDYDTIHEYTKYFSPDTSLPANLKHGYSKGFVYNPQDASLMYWVDIW